MDEAPGQASRRSACRRKKSLKGRDRPVFSKSVKSYIRKAVADETDNQEKRVIRRESGTRTRNRFVQVSSVTPQSKSAGKPESVRKKTIKAPAAMRDVAIAVDRGRRGYIEHNVGYAGPRRRTR